MIWAIITLQREGFHYWKDAPKAEAFLHSKHRHIFHLTIFVQQNSNERDIEYIQFKHWLEITIPDIDGPESCETIATKIKIHIEKYFNNSRKVKVQVMEDNENGALVE